MTIPVIILGDGGYARTLFEVLRRCDVKVLGCTGRAAAPAVSLPEGLVYLGSDDAITASPDEVNLVNGLGSVGSTEARRGIFTRFKEKGYNFATLVHPSAVLAADVTLGEGVQVMAGTVLQSGCVLGDNTIVNIGVVIDHDGRIGAHSHLAPGAALSGGVTLGEGVHVGTGAALIQGIIIGAGALVAAGAVVVRDVPEGAKVMGVPAREAPG